MAELECRKIIQVVLLSGWGADAMEASPKVPRVFVKEHSRAVHLYKGLIGKGPM